MNATQTGTAGTPSPGPTRTGSLSASTQPVQAEATNDFNRSGITQLPPNSATSSTVLGNVGEPRPGRSSMSRIKFPGGVVLGLFVIGWAARYFALSQAWVKTDNAYLAAHIHTISSRVAGTVAEVFVDENQTVSGGALLARLDARDFETRRAQALAQLSGARAQVLEAEARIAQARAQISREQARATKAKSDLARASTLFEGGSGAISKQELESARSESDATQAACQVAQSALDSAIALAASAQAQEQAAAAGLRDADLQLSYTEIRAPSAGRIGKKNLESGNRVQPGQALLALVQPELWVTANFKETQLAYLRPGQNVRVKVDAFPGRILHGTVESISPATGAEFALLPPDNATGNFTKIVQRVPVKIALDAASVAGCSGRPAAGMSALVEVQVRE